VAQLPAKRKIVVLGDTGSPDDNKRDVYRDVGRNLAQFADLVICIGSHKMQSVRAGGVAAGMTYAQFIMAGSRVGPATQFLQENIRTGDLVLFKGTARQKLQRLALDLQGHQVACGVKFCNVKVDSCINCPLLNAPASRFSHPLVSRFIQV
jgi:UDP-N-acetylmuramyl pentapeptide synthase